MKVSLKQKSTYVYNDGYSMKHLMLNFSHRFIVRRALHGSAQAQDSARVTKEGGVGRENINKLFYPVHYYN